MRILVTGGAGFIGSHFVRLLLGPEESRHHTAVTVLDALTYAGNLTNLAAVADDPRLTFVHGDVRDRAKVFDLVESHDTVVHFAAESHVDRSLSNASNFVSTNVQGTQTLLDALLHHSASGIDRTFLHVSTDEVYGSIEEGFWPESHPLAPRSPYAASKAAADLIVLAHHHTYGLDVRVTRSSNNYGPYQYPEKIIPLFTTRLLDGGTVPLYGNGRNVRDWLHVEDHCLALLRVLENGRPGEVYNIGAENELSNLQLTRMLLSACGASSASIEYVADRKGHDLRYAVDISKIRNELRWTPRHAFADGLACTVAWYRDNRSWWEPLNAANRGAVRGTAPASR
ncbi:dTDP-glucose 4,6-dehydratase [Streptomyces sp. G44]|uniref:dTDP-glucose 4,6-dehydratase n=1 Tax=Streptomyces sp. G44 TaxID=2807632 RepID=UPI00196215CB|nr:dTDP-glucose 4,6-dehydratase [Streptomyces sp. G44]MBM7167511.1 dTDP-glucose 4,6-dehydratase [Streptomyces sp. G44]